MKKLYFFLLICSSAVAVIGQTPNLVIDKLPASAVFTLDGKADEGFWNLIQQNDITKLDATHPATLPDGAWFKMTWSDTALYMILFVGDDNLCNQWCTGLANYQSDRPEIYFVANTWPGGPQPGASKGGTKGVYQYVGDQAFGTDTVAKYIGYQANFYGEAEHVTDPNYTFEFYWPWTSLKDSMGVAIAPADLKTFGLDVYIMDRDPSDAPFTDANRKWAYWFSPTGGAWDNAGSVGTVQMRTNIVGIPDLNSSSEIVISPNPASDIINVKADFDEAVISDLSGRQVADLKNLKSSNIDISSLGKGVYFITLRKNNQNIGTSKFIKR